MLDEIKSLFKEGLEYTHTAGLLQQIANMLNIVNAQYLKDGNARNAALDLLCKILQSHKDTVAASPVNPPAATTPGA
jgi:hypothetical protein